ncbi:MAG: type II toxin-antitoxin system VapB family antitoxin [Actinomycetota bacterium]|nr:type II toxin-antitoxin system VapB family antitoxin [Actinomycetota bacterium]
MAKRTTIEIDEQLLARAKRALGAGTTRATVEEALRRAADGAEAERLERAGLQVSYLRRLQNHVDRDALRSEQMWS